MVFRSFPLILGTRENELFGESPVRVSHLKLVLVFDREALRLPYRNFTSSPPACLSSEGRRLKLAVHVRPRSGITRELAHVGLQLTGRSELPRT